MNSKKKDITKVINNVRDRRLTDNIAALFLSVIFNNLILQELCSYLNGTNIDMNNLLNASRIFYILKRTHFCWNLNKEHSRKYYNDANYKSKLDSLIACGRKQLSLNLSRCPDVVDVSALGNVYELNLEGCDKINDVSDLGNVHTLNLSGCRNVVDVSTLGNVYALNIADCNNIIDISSLRNVHTLDLLCSNITDVSTLENTHTLSLRGCRNIVDVSALFNVHELDLTYCDNVVDFSALGSVSILHLSQYTRTI